MNIRTISAALLLAGLTVSAGAQTFPGAAGDLILGVRVAGGTATNDLIVDLGSANGFTSNQTWSLGTDLGNVFGTQWQTSGNVAWSVVGGDATNALGDGVNTIWAAGPNGAALTRSTKSNQGNLIGTIANYNTTWGGTTVNTTVGDGGLYIAKTDPASYTTTITTGGTAVNSFGYTSWGVSNIESDTASGTGAALYELKYGTGVGIDLGTFTLNATSGMLTFTAIPEPSTYAIILGVAALGFVMLRRRQQVLA